MTKWSQEQEAAYKAAKKAIEEAARMSRSLRQAREQAIKLLGEVLGGMPRASDVDHAAMGSWAAERAKTLIDLLTPFLPQEAEPIEQPSAIPVGGSLVHPDDAVRAGAAIGPNFNPMR